MQNKKTKPISINPLELGVVYLGFSALLLGIEPKGLYTTILGWLSFAASVFLFIAVFEKHIAKFLNEKGRVGLLFSASILGTVGTIVGILNFLSGKGGWIVTLFAIFLLLWLFVTAGADAGVAKNKKVVFLIALAMGIFAVIRFAYCDYVEGVISLAFSIFLFLVGKGTIKLLTLTDP